VVVVALTKEEKAAGRWFRDACQLTLDRLNFEEPPIARCSPHSPPFFRHVCTGLGTTALPLHDDVSESPEIAVVPDDGRLRGMWAETWSEELDGPRAGTVPAGRFTYTVVEGSCHKDGCGFTVRSGTGRFEVAEVETESG
jgi:hypothetical protein